MEEYLLNTFKGDESRNLLEPSSKEEKGRERTSRDKPSQGSVGDPTQSRENLVEDDSSFCRLQYTTVGLFSNFL